MVSRFGELVTSPPVEVFQLSSQFREDHHPNKVSLEVGAYRTDDDKPWILPVVKEAEQKIANQISEDQLNYDYLPFLGLETFYTLATKMLLGEESSAINEGRAFGIQCASGTGALRLGAEFLNTVLGYDTFYISDPTWLNHPLIFKSSGFKVGRKYRYWDYNKKVLNFDAMIADLEGAPENSVIILQACAHNPTGIDPSKEQWIKIADLVQLKKLFPFFDCAYQGFASGCLATDAWPVRYFADRGLEMFVAQSFSKNFGLYNERCGNLTVVIQDSVLRANLESHMMLLIRGMCINPPMYGARIVNIVLKDPQLYADWQNSIKTMAKRIIQMRQELRKRLEKLGTPGKWNHITDQIGMFSFTGLSPDMTNFLVKEKHVYLLSNGLISMCGLTYRNIDYVAQSISEAVFKFQ